MLQCVAVSKTFEHATNQLHTNCIQSTPHRFLVEDPKSGTLPDKDVGALLSRNIFLLRNLVGRGGGKLFVREKDPAHAYARTYIMVNQDLKSSKIRVNF